MMAKRKPLKLRGILAMYNLLQIFQNAKLLWILFGTPGFVADIAKHACVPPDRDNNDFYLAISGLMWHFFILKFMDLLDTVFFVLRKKQSHVTFLHVYHHTVMLILAWFHVKYLRNEQMIFTGMLNAVTHILMYSYYFMASLGPSVKKHLWWKHYITRMQIIQFVLDALYIAGLVYYDCNITTSLAVFSAFVVLSFLLLFIQFYYQAYKKKNT